MDCVFYKTHKDSINFDTEGELAHFSFIVHRSTEPQETDAKKLKCAEDTTDDTPKEQSVVTGEYYTYWALRVTVVILKCDHMQLFDIPCVILSIY